MYMYVYVSPVRHGLKESLLWYFIKRWIYTIHMHAWKKSGHVEQHHLGPMYFLCHFLLLFFTFLQTRLTASLWGIYQFSDIDYPLSKQPGKGST